MILICFLGERLPPRSSGVDLRADERSPSRETGFLPACRTAERPRQKQVGQAPSGNRGAARQRVHPEVHRETLQFFACQPRKLAEEARNQETAAVKSYGGFGTFEPLGVANCNHNWFGLQSSRFLDRINCDYRGVKTELIANETTLIATRLQSSGSNHINCE